MFAVQVVRFKSGEQMPLLTRMPHSQPVLLPLIYFVLRRRHKSVNTIRRDALILKWLYEWTAEYLSLDLDDALASGDFDSISKNLENFSFWLRSGRIANNISGRIGKAPNPNQDWLHPKTYNDYLICIQAYLLWAIERYSRQENSTTLRKQIIEIKDKVKSKFDALILGGKSEIEVKGLEPYQVDGLLKLITVDSSDNPFRRNTQLRNGLIVRIFLETGLRRGELLKLKTTDIHEVDNKYYLVVKRHPDDPTDLRAMQPAQKTLSRTVSISEKLYSDIERYILINRRPTKNGKKSSLKHQFLITSDHGSPLSQTAVNYIFDVIHDKIFQKTSTLFHPHLLRNTFCNNYLEWCVDKNGITLEKALDELRQICGWSLTSKMPLRYGAKWITGQANTHNHSRVNAAWDLALNKGLS